MEMRREHESSNTVTEQQAARYLGFSLPTLRRWRYAGPAHIKIGRSIRYIRADLDRFMDAHRSAEKS